MRWGWGVILVVFTTCEVASAGWVCNLIAWMTGTKTVEQVSPQLVMSAPPSFVAPRRVAATQPEISERPATPVQVPKDGSLIPRVGERFLNGSLMDVTDADGKPRRVLVFSHYMTGHSAHAESDSLPQGWKVVRIVQRGEYKMVDGQAVHVNPTSGDAAREGASNQVEDAQKYLEGSTLARPTTRYTPFDAEKPHLYDGFNEPGGPPKGLHSLRLRTVMAFALVHDFLELGDSARLAKNPRDPKLLVAHWDMIVAGTGDRYVTTKIAMESLAEGFDIPPAIAKEVLAEMKELRAKMRQIEIREIPAR